MRPSCLPVPIPTPILAPPPGLTLAYDSMTADRGGCGYSVGFRGPGRGKNKNYCERSRYMYENKENMDNMPAEKTDIYGN